ncbi:MAG: 4'-phosphopantetheinyl transferase superfamily protein [Bacteroidales bacterium]|nr:4'-phosphopantetheinyl transferase superfamily protein [Bacteroidales bacterium]
MVYRIFDDMNQCSEAEVQRLLPLVSAQRRERALRHKFCFGQYACLKSYEMLAQLLVEQNLVPAVENGLPELQFAFLEHEKPYLPAFPDVHFNISHCKQAIAVAVHEGPVGIDVETIRPEPDALIRKTMNEAECRHIASSVDPKAAFVELWTKKEAVLKFRGTGIIENLQNVLAGPYRIITLNEGGKPYVCSICY